MKNESSNYQPKAASQPKGILRRLRENQNGSFALMAGLILPVVCVGGMFAIDSYYRVMMAKKFDEYVRNACYRSIKPTRTQFLQDADRQATAQRLAENSFATGQDADFQNLEIQAEAGWLTGRVTASATFAPALNLLGNGDVAVASQFDCEGIPPYPTDGEELMNTQFTNEQGNALVLSNPYIPPPQPKNPRIPNCWQAFNGVDKIGWDGAQGWRLNRDVNLEPNAPGQIEVQFWGEHPTAGWSGCFSSGDPVNGYPPLPRDAPSVYGIELDAYYNNEIWKDIELHPGHYEMSVWYFPRGRVPTTSAKKQYPRAAQFDYWDDVTNGMGFYLQGLRGSNPLRKTPAICVNGKKDDGWKKVTYRFRVDEYNVYRLSVKGEQINDSVGGTFNSLVLNYLDDVNSTKSFPNEYILGESEFSSYDNCTDYLDNQVYNRVEG